MTGDDTEWQPHSTFWLDVGWASVGLVPAFFVPFATALVAATPIVIGSIVICILGVGVFAVLTGVLIGDWWDNFKEANRVTFFGLAAALVVPPLGAVCGSLL